MTHHSTSPRHAVSRVLPIATAAFAIGIFIADTLTSLEIAVAVLYVAIVLMAARFLRARGVLLVSAGCVSLTVLSFLLSPRSPRAPAGVINTFISILAIGLTTWLVRRGQSAEAALREQTNNDIAERKQTQESLQRAQANLERFNRVMLLGEMTASIAHQVNQPITATVTNASACLRWLAAQPPGLEDGRLVLECIIRDGQRAGEVIRRIRALIKRVPPRRDRLDINEAILEVLALAHSELQRNEVKLQTLLSSDLPLVLADRVQLQQAILNLTINAVEAMSGVRDRPRELVVGSGRSASDVFVEVRDSGLGLDPASLDRLFDSFYTTKRGCMGLGLPISRSIVESHGGRLWAAPNKPYGAVFRVALPLEPTLPA